MPLSKGGVVVQTSGMPEPIEVRIICTDADTAAVMALLYAQYDVLMHRRYKARRTEVVRHYMKVTPKAAAKAAV